jgi:hypothetical protein
MKLLKRMLDDVRKVRRVDVIDFVAWLASQFENE